MIGVIDRFEGEYAVVELDDGKMKNIEIALLPPEVAEGTVLVIDDDNIYVDKDETERRKEKAEKLLDDLFG
ncbi:MAG TPA: DUF3006 domain-containing protein [Thermoanaerobacterales bacterium]|nr:DUF3006 domain-containing protein [Thermoanaerobacterales bacterium]